MKIKKIESQMRRDFYAIYECEHCGHTNRGSGYNKIWDCGNLKFERKISYD